MAEVQTSTTSGEMTFRFIEFVRMHAQSASLFMGLIPHPQTGKPHANLEVARMLIEQLAAISHKTRGNLTTEEETVLKTTLTGLQAAFVEVSKAASTGASPQSQPTTPPAPKIS